MQIVLKVSFGPINITLVRICFSPHLSVQGHRHRHPPRHGYHDCPPLASGGYGRNGRHGHHCRFGQNKGRQGEKGGEIETLELNEDASFI